MAIISVPNIIAPTHGNRHVSGASDPIPDVVAAGASGLMTGADKTKLDGIPAGGVSFTTWANRPAAGVAGRLHIPTDGYYPARDTGSAWIVQAIPGVDCTNPPAANTFTILNFASSTLVADGDGLLFTTVGTNSTGEFNAVAVKAIPGGGAYTFTVGLDIVLIHPTFYSTVGVCITDGIGATPKALLWNIMTGQVGSTNPGLIINHTRLTNLTTWNSDPWWGQSGGITSNGKLFIRLYDDRSSNIIFSVSNDNRNYAEVLRIARAAWLTPAYIGVVHRQSVTAVATTSVRSMNKIFHWSLG